MLGQGVFSNSIYLTIDIQAICNFIPLSMSLFGTFGLNRISLKFDIFQFFSFRHEDSVYVCRVNVNQIPICYVVIM